MLILLVLPVIATVAAAHCYLQSYAPTNLLTRHVRAREPRWSGAVLSALTAALLVAMHVLGEAIANGAPAWLNLVVLVLAWDAIKVGCLAVWVLARWIWFAVRRLLTARGQWSSQSREGTPPWTPVGVQGYPADLR